MDKGKRAGLYSPDNPASSPIKTTFATALGDMFGFPIYSVNPNEMQNSKVVQFTHSLVSIGGDTDTFARPDAQPEVTRH